MSGGMPGPAPDERPVPEGRRNSQGIRIDPAVEAEAEPRRAVISVLVDHEPGVLSEIAGLFSRRQFNIESLTVGPTADSGRARITVVCEEPDPGIVQLERQLEKLLSVISVRELPADAIRRELALVKVDGERPEQVRAVAEMYDAKTVDACPETVTVEVTGSRQKVEAAIESFGRFGVRELVRTGTTAMARGTTRTAGPDPAAPDAEGARQDEYARGAEQDEHVEEAPRDEDGGAPSTDVPTEEADD